MIKKIQIICVLIFSSLFFQACTPSSMVNLNYSAGENQFLPSPNAPRVSVVSFEDVRTNSYLGQKNDGSFYSPTSLVSEWASRAVAEELSLLGPQVSYAINLQEANSANPHYIVTGKVLDVWVKEINPAQYEANVRIEFALSQGNRVLYSETLNSSQESTDLPNTARVEELLNATLKDVAGVAASKINEQTK